MISSSGLRAGGVAQPKKNQFAIYWCDLALFKPAPRLQVTLLVLALWPSGLLAFGFGLSLTPVGRGHLPLEQRHAPQVWFKRIFALQL